MCFQHIRLTPGRSRHEMVHHLIGDARQRKEVACLLSKEMLIGIGRTVRSIRCPQGREYAMGVLRLCVLGTPEVFHNGTRLTFALRKGQALLLYLAVEGGMHPRSKLAAFLWPDSEPHDARTALRNALALLRTLLDNASPSPYSHLRSERDLLGLDPQAPLELDLDVVQQAWKE